MPGGRVAFGNPTKAVATVGDLATSNGIYADVPVSTFYNMKVDARVNRYSNAPGGTADLLTGQFHSQIRADGRHPLEA